MTYLATLTKDIENINREKGWYDEPRSFGDSIALLHSEVSEMLEAYRRWGTEDATERELVEERINGGVKVRVTRKTPAAKPEGVGAEAADVLIRLLDICGRYGIDLEAETERKLAYNRTRSYRHGSKKL